MKNLFIRTGDFEEKSVNKSLILIPKNGIELEGCILEDSAKIIWEYLNKPRSMNEIIDHLKEKYKLYKTDLQLDTFKFLVELMDNGCVKSVNGVKLELLNIGHAKELAFMLTYDEKLKNALNITNGTTKEGFYQYTTKWQEKTNSNTFTIIFDDKPIGIISLSHLKGISARIGYWIASDYWNLGLCTTAFKKVIQYAKEYPLQSVSCTLNKNNVASIKIWEHYNSEFNLVGENYKVNLKL